MPDVPVRTRTGETGQTGEAGQAGEVREVGEGVAVVVLHEGLPHQGVGALRRELGRTLDAGAHTLVVDLSGVPHLSSVVVALLLRAKRCCRARGGRVVLRGLDRAHLQVLHRTGLSPLFQLEPR
ncbi:STAS domain-containing protein [Kineococcus sp. SYSU DK005]|uniref:STAS domain-containing protein n=1 Tax=Kineococcus sp. SYSU DK005 TaxID=3383126 RepID=UPI003D7CD8B7